MDFQTLSDIPNLTHLTGIITAVGGLGTAAYGIVDVTKSLGGGVSNCGFPCIAKTMATLIPEKSIKAAASTDTSEPVTPPALALSSILITLKSNWVNGMASSDQRAIAKSLVKLRMSQDLVPTLAQLTGVNATILASVAAKIASGTPLTPDETDVYSRFDLVLTTLLDQAYQRADQQYRNMAKLSAVIASLALAGVGAWSLGEIHGFFLYSQAFWQAILMGVLATPLAPVAKDLASAVQAGAKAVQSWGR